MKIVDTSFKITCFGKHLAMATSIRCCFNTSNLKQYGLSTTYSCAQNKNIKIISKIVSLKKIKKKKKYYSHICLCNVLLWTPMVFKSVSSSHSENAGPVIRDHVKSYQMKNETPLQLKKLFLYAATGTVLLFFYFFRSQIYQYF